jgi:hypothetical protein
MCLPLSEGRANPNDRNHWIIAPRLTVHGTCRPRIEHALDRGPRLTGDGRGRCHPRAGCRYRLSVGARGRRGLGRRSGSLRPVPLRGEKEALLFGSPGLTASPGRGAGRFAGGDIVPARSGPLSALATARRRAVRASTRRREDLLLSPALHYPRVPMPPLHHLRAPILHHHLSRLRERSARLRAG